MSTAPDIASVPAADVPWWRRAVTYQVYVRSFADGNGDGIGDLAGLRAKLPYLAELGVDAIWSNPWYPSPLLDGGYDVADYRDIDPRIGTLAEAEALIEKAHALGIRVLGDLVPNHTSWEHAWFREALVAGPSDPARSRYLFREGRGEHGELPPNNWTSFFGGPAWTRVSALADDPDAAGLETAGDGQWYLHLFDRSQPDLDWTNPEVVAEFEDILRFWLDRGIDGFRVDVAHSLTKAPGLPDITDRHVQNEVTTEPDHPYLDREDLHDIVRGWRAVLDEYDDRMMIAEAYVPAARIDRYLRDDEYHQVFNFTFLDDGWRPHRHNVDVPLVVEHARDHGTAPTWVLSNHDQVRHTTRFALPEHEMWFSKEWLKDGPRWWLDEEQGLRRARAAALLQLALPGSVYLYQGEELGLPEAYDLPDEVLQDPEFFRSDRKGRDGCRVPLPWDADEPGYGFGSADPWLPQPPSFAAHAAAQQASDDGSTLALYRRALALRRELLVDDEDVEFLELGRDVVGIRRGNGLTCVVNMGCRPVELPAGEVVLASGEVPVDGMLPADDAVWLR